MLKKCIILFTTALFSLTGCKKVDNTAPTIKLIGPDLVYHILNQKYIDQGVIVYDNNDKTIEAVADINVDENRIGSYLVTWTVVDKSGNTASIDRTVIVFNEADSLKGNYSGICTKPYPDGDSWNIENDNVFVDSLTNNKLWFTRFSAYDSCYVYMMITDSLSSIPEQAVKIFIDSTEEITFHGNCTINNNSFEIDYYEKMLTDSIVCKTILNKN